MSITPTTVQLYTTLWEGDVVERVTYQLYNRNITIDKLPRTLLEKYKNEEELHCHTSQPVAWQTHLSEEQT